MDKTNRLDEKAFTLIEVLVAASILLIILGLGFNLMTTSLSLQRQTTETLDLQQSARFAMESITRDLRNATDVEIINSHQLRFNDGVNWVQYRITNQQLIRDENNSSSPVASNITNLNFIKQGFLIKIDLTANKGEQQINLRSNVYLKRDFIE